MAIKHIKRRQVSSSESESSDEGSASQRVEYISKFNNEKDDLKKSKQSDSKYATNQNGAAAKDDLKSTNNDVINNESDTGSDSEEETIFYRPTFIKKAKSASSQSKEQKSRSNHILERVLDSNEIMLKQEKLERLMSDNYGSDKQLIQLALQLNDDDTADPEFEKKCWQERENRRQQRYREQLIAKQLEIEQNEAKKINIELDKNNLVDSSKVGTLSPEKILQKSVHQTNTKSKHKYKPSKIQDMKFEGSISCKRDDQDDEYSVYQPNANAFGNDK